MKQRVLVTAVTVLAVLATGACTRATAPTAIGERKATATVTARDPASVTPAAAATTPPATATASPGNHGTPAAQSPAPPATPPKQTPSGPASGLTPADREACRAAYEAQFLLPAVIRPLAVLESVTSTEQERANARDEIVGIFTYGTGMLANASAAATTPALKAALDRAADAFAVAVVVAAVGSIDEIRGLLHDGTDMDRSLIEANKICLYN